MIDDHYKSGGTSVAGGGGRGFNLQGLGDLAGVTQIETLDLGGGSRRGSFSKPNPMGGANRTGGSESKDRSNIHIPRPQTAGRPQTQDNRGFSQDRAYDAGVGGIGGLGQRKGTNPHSEAHSSYKDYEDDDLSHIQSDYGGASNLGGGIGGNQLLLKQTQSVFPAPQSDSLIPLIETVSNKNRRMAGGGRPSTTNVKPDDLPIPSLTKGKSAFVGGLGGSGNAGSSGGGLF